MLFTLEVLELIKYAQSSQRDPIIIKLLLAFMVLIDIAACVNACTMVYLVRLAQSPALPH
jgi:hypothetical protein